MILILIGFFAVLIIASPKTALEAAGEAYKICETTLIPALFPFFVISNLLMALNGAQYLSRLAKPIMKPFFKVSENGALAVIMGIISGYPVGAKVASDLKCRGDITKSEAEKLLAFCNNSGPLFILGTVGSGMLFCGDAGRVLYATHILSAVLVAVLMRNLKCETVSAAGNNAKAKNFGEALTDSVSASMNSVFVISGFVMISAIILTFSEKIGIIDMVSKLGINKDLARCILYGMVEPVNGCAAAARLDTDIVNKCMIISSIIGWSGMSVHLQVAGIIKKAGLKIKYYICGKLLSVILSPCFVFLIFKAYPYISLKRKVSFHMPFEISIMYYMGIFCLFLIGCLFYLFVFKRSHAKLFFKHGNKM